MKYILTLVLTFTSFIGASAFASDNAHPHDINFHNATNKTVEKSAFTTGNHKKASIAVVQVKTSGKVKKHGVYIPGSKANKEK